MRHGAGLNGTACGLATSTCKCGVGDQQEEGDAVEWMR